MNRIGLKIYLLAATGIVFFFLPNITHAAGCQDNSITNRLQTELGIDVATANPPIDLSKLSASSSQEISNDLQILYRGRIALSGDPDCGDEFPYELGLTSLSQIIQNQVSFDPASAVEDTLFNALTSMMQTDWADVSDVVDYLNPVVDIFAELKFEDDKAEQDFIAFYIQDMKSSKGDDQVAWAEVEKMYSGYGYGPQQIPPDDPDILWAVDNLTTPQRAGALHAEAQLTYEAADDQTFQAALKDQVLQDLAPAEVQASASASNPVVSILGNIWGTITGVIQGVANVGQNIVQVALDVIDQYIPAASPKNTTAADAIGALQPNNNTLTEPQAGQGGNVLQPTQSSEPCIETSISFPQNGDTYSLSDPNFPFNAKNYKQEMVVFSTKNPSAYYNMGILATTMNEAPLIAGSASVPSLAGQCSNNSIGATAFASPITEPGKYYWILYRIDNIPGVEVSDQCSQGILNYMCLKEPNGTIGVNYVSASIIATIQNEWFQYIEGKGPAPTNDYYVSMVTITP